MWQVALLVLITGFQVVLGAGLYLVWRRLRSVTSPLQADVVAPLRKELSDLGRHFDGKFDLLLTQSLSQSNLNAGLNSLAGAVQALSTQEKPAVAAHRVGAEQEVPPVSVSWPPDPESSGQGQSAPPRIEALLSRPDFLSTVWQDMDGAFDVASGHLLHYLSEHGVAEPHIEAFPPLMHDNPNHWIFAVVQSRDGRSEGHRILIPRNFSRYDPAIHDHLFEVRGKRPTLDNYLREIQKCALLKSMGELKGFIARELVEQKGVVIV